MSTDALALSQQLATAVSQFGPRVVRVEGRRRRPGSGFVFASGLVVTANHTLEHEEGVVVGVDAERTLSAHLVGRDPTTDVALLRADVDTPVAPPAPLEELRVGHLVLSLARPGRTVRATFGILSAAGDAWRTPLGGEVDRYLESDLFLAPGFGGGPMVDAAGRLLGLATSAF